MASPQIPVLLNESLNLTNVGVSPDSIKFGSTSMESDKFITVCTHDGQMIIIDMANGNQVKKWPIKAEAAIMNPKSEVLALRSGSTLQVGFAIQNFKMPRRYLKIFTYCNNFFWGVGCHRLTLS